MLINTDNIIPKTKLRENLSEIMDMVQREKKTVAISDRGVIISVISPIIEEKVKKTTKAKKKIDFSKHPAFGIWKDDPRSDEELLNTLSGGWW